MSRKVLARWARDQVAEHKYWWAIFGGILGAPALISSIVRLFNISLVEILSGLLGAYSSLLQAIESTLLYWTVWRPPEFVANILILHIILLAACLRSEYLVKGPLVRGRYSRYEIAERKHYYIGAFVPLYLPLYITFRIFRFRGGLHKYAAASSAWILSTAAREETKREEYQMDLYFFSSIYERYKKTIINLAIGIATSVLTLLSFLAWNVIGRAS